MTGSIPLWQGARGLEGLPDGDDQPLTVDWYSEEGWAADDWIDLMATWVPLEALEAPDPPAPWGFDLSSAGTRASGDGGNGGGGGGGRRARSERVTGRISVLASNGGGLKLEGHDDLGWANASQYADPPVSFSGLRKGDLVQLECDRAKNGRLYVRSVAVLEGEGDAAADVVAEGAFDVD